MSTSDWLSHTSVPKKTFNRSLEHHTTSYSIKRNCTLNVSRESTPNSTALRKRKKLLQTNMKQHWILNISHLQLGQSSCLPGANPDRHSPSHHQHYLLGGHGLLRRYWFWKTWTKSLKGGRSSHILSEVIPILDCVGKRRISCSQYDTWQEGTGYNREWEWWALVILG